MKNKPFLIIVPLITILLFLSVFFTACILCFVNDENSEYESIQASYDMFEEKLSTKEEIEVMKLKNEEFWQFLKLNHFGAFVE